MPNVALVLKEEITRLSRRELRRQLRTIKKFSATARGHIAALRKQITALQREVSDLRKRAFARSAEAATSSDATKTRFVAKGLRSHRARLGLSAEDYGRLVGVSAQTIYSWERETSTPRAAQRAFLASVRGLGKREAQTRLEAVRSRGPQRARPTRR